MAWRTVTVVHDGERLTRKVWVPDPKPAASAASQALKRRKAAEAAKAAKAAAARRAAAQAAATQKAVLAARQAEIAERQRRAIQIAQRRAASYRELAERRKALLRKAGLVKDSTKDTTPRRNTTTALRPGMSAARPNVYEPGERVAPRTHGARAVEAARQARSNDAYAARYQEAAYWTRKRAAVKATGPYDASRAREAERILAIEKKRAGEGRIDSETVQALSEQYVKYAEGIGTQRNKIVDEISALLDKAKKGDEKALAKARKLYFGKQFQALDREYQRLYGGEDGAFSKYWKSYEAIEQAQVDYWKRQMQSALDNDRSELNKRLKIARAKGDAEAVKRLTELSAVYAGKTGQVIDHYERRVVNGKETKVPVYRARTVEEELAHREAARRVEMERERARLYELQRGRRLALRGRGLVELPSGETVTPEAAAMRREVDAWISRGGQFKEMKRPEDIQQNAEAFLKDWERRNPRPAGNAGMWGQGGTSNAFKLWKDRRDGAEREFYKHIAGLPGTPAWYERVMAAPGVSHALALLEGAANVGITGGRIALKAGTGSSQLTLDIPLADLPVGVQQQVKAAKGARGFGALGGAFSAGTQMAAEQKVLSSWLATPAGKAFFREWSAKNKARIQEEDSRLAAALYGAGTDPATVAARLFSAEGLDAINEYGRNPTSNPGANLLLQLALDPTNAIPLKFTTYAARAAYAAGRTGQRGNKITKAYGAITDFINVDENILKSRKRVAELIPALADGGGDVEKLTDNLLAEVANVKPKDATTRGIRDALIKAGFDRRLVEDTELMSLIESAITGRMRRAGIDYRDMSGELKKQIAETQRVQRNLRVKRHEKAARAERRTQKGLQFRARAAEQAEVKLKAAKVREAAAAHAEAERAREAHTAARPRAAAVEPVPDRGPIGESSPLPARAGSTSYDKPPRVPYPEPEVANRGIAARPVEFKPALGEGVKKVDPASRRVAPGRALTPAEAARAPYRGGEVPGRGMTPNRPAPPDTGFRGREVGPVRISARGHALLTLRHTPDIEGARTAAAVGRALDARDSRRVFTETAAADNVDRAIREVEKRDAKAPRRHLAPEMRVQDPAAQPRHEPLAPAGTKALSPTELQHLDYELRHGEWVPQGAFSEASPYLTPAQVAQAKELGKRAAAGDAKAAEKYRRLSERLRAMFRTLREDGELAGAGRGRRVRLNSGTFRPGQLDLTDRAGVTGDVVAEREIREVRAMLGYVRRVVAQQLAGRVPGGKFKPGVKRLDAEEVQLAIDSDALLQQVINDAELRLPNGEMYNLAEDLLDAASSARGVADIYEVFTGHIWETLKGYKVDLAAQIPWIPKIRSEAWRAKMTLTHFKLILHSLDESETFFRGATTGAERFRDGGLALFELFHQLRLAGDVKRLQRYGGYVDRYLDELAGRGEADLSLFAWQWKVMETNAGLPWSRPFAEVRDGFRKAAVTNGVHPDLSLAMIPNGYYAAKSQWRFNFSRPLAGVPKLGEFAPYDGRWTDWSVANRISDIFHGIKKDDGLTPAVRAASVIHYLATRFGTFEKGSQLKLRLLDELVGAALRDLPKAEFLRLMSGDFWQYIPARAREAALAQGKTPGDIVWNLAHPEKIGKGIITFPHLRDAVLEAWKAGRLPLKNVEAHKLIWMAHLQDSPGAVVGITIAFADNMAAIGKLDEATALVRELWPEMRGAYLRRYADMLVEARPGEIETFVGGLEHQMWKKLGLLPSDAEMGKLAEHYRRAARAADSDAVDTGEATFLSPAENRKLKELGQFDDPEEIAGWDAEAAAVGRRDPGSAYTGGDLSNLSIEMEEALDVAARVVDSRKIEEELAVVEGMDDLEVAMRVGLAHYLLDDVARSGKNGKGLARQLDAETRAAGGALFGAPGRPLGLRKQSDLALKVAEERGWVNVEKLLRAKKRAISAAADRVDRLLLAIVENDITRMAAQDWAEVEEAIEVLASSPLARQLLEDLADRVGDGVRWSKLESGRLDFYARRAHLQLLARVMPPDEFAEEGFVTELRKLDEALSLSDEQWRARIAARDRDQQRRLATPDLTGSAGVPDVPKIEFVDTKLPEMPKIEYPAYEAPEPDPALVRRAQLAEDLSQRISGMSLREYYGYLAVRANTILKSRTASKAQKERARTVLNEIKAVRYLDQLRAGGSPIPPGEVRAFGERVVKRLGDEAKGMIAPKYVAPFVEDVTGIFVERGRTYYRRLMSTDTVRGGVARLGNAVDAPDHMPYDVWVKVEAEVQAAIRRARDGFRANNLTKLRGLPNEGEPEGRLLKRMVDKDPAILRAKKAVLRKHGISLQAYDEARTVLWTGHVQGISSARLLRKAMDRVARTGEALDEAYIAERLVEAEEEAVRRLEELARLRYGHSPDDIMEEFIARYSDDGTIRHPRTKLTGFQRRTLEAHLLAASKEAGAEVTDIADVAQMQTFLTLRNAPPTGSREAARDFLTRIGAWSPRKAELINEGKASWSIDEEAEYWMHSWAQVPVWADRLRLQGEFNLIFHDPEAYFERMREWGVLSRSAEIRVKLSGATAQEIEEKLLTGDPALGIRARRDLELQRRFAIERYGDLVYDKQTGQLTAMPWLMHEWEKRAYFKKRVAGEFGQSLIQGADELDEVVAMIDDVLDKYFDRYIGVKSAAGPVAYEDVFRLAAEVQARLLANPKWTRRMRDIFGDILRAWAAFNRAIIFTQLSFAAVNAIDVPIKMSWYRWTRRGIFNAAAQGSAAALRRAEALTPQMLGLDLETTLYRLKQRPIIAKMTDPVHTGVAGIVERGLAPIEGLYRASPTVAGKVEMWGKMRIAKQIYAHYFDEAMRAGAASEDLADAAARRIVKDEMSRMWPTAGDHPLARLWNEIVPFGIYTVKNKVLFLSEALAHPWILNKIEFIGRFIEEHNRREYEKTNPGERMPDRDARRIELPWAKGYYLDLGQFSDATRGLAPIYRTGGKSLVDHVSPWIRLINPGTLAAAGYVANTLSLGGIRKWKPVLNADGRVVGYQLVTSPWTEPWSDEEPGFSSFIWVVDAFEDALAAGADGQWTLGEVSVLLGKLALFNAITPGASRGPSLYEYYKALREKDPDGARAWLNGTPSGQYLSDWLKSRSASERDFVDFYSRTKQLAADKNLWLHQKSEAFQKRVREGYDLISQVKERFAAELMMMAKGTQAYRDKKGEMYLAISEVYRRYPELVDFEVYSKSPQEWAKQLAYWQQDKLMDDFFALDGLRPKRADFATQADYKAAYDAWLHTKQLFLKQYPQVEQALGKGRAEYERVRDQIEAEWSATLDRIGTRSEAIEAAKKANDRELLDILYLQQELDFSKLDQERVALDFSNDDFATLPKGMLGPPTLRDKALKRAEVFVDFEARRRAKAEREGRLQQYLDQKFYGDGMAEVILKAKGGDPFGEFDPGIFVAEMKKRPRLLAMYEKANPGTKSRWAKNESYVKYISRWGQLARAGRWDEAQRVWDNLPQWVKDRYYAKHPERRRRAQQTAEYSGWMKRWVAHFERGDSKGGMKFFWSMPAWVRERYFAKNPGKRVKYEADLKYGKQLADYFAADREMQARYLREHPDFARWLAKNVGGGESRRTAILAAYKAIPASEQWLRRVFREKYPEIFSPEAAGERKLRKVYDRLAAHPEMLPEFEAWVKAIWDSYAEMLMKGQARPLSSYYEMDYGEVPARKRRRSLSAAEASA